MQAAPMSSCLLLVLYHCLTSIHLSWESISLDLFHKISFFPFRSGFTGCLVNMRLIAHVGSILTFPPFFLPYSLPPFHCSRVSSFYKGWRRSGHLSLQNVWTTSRERVHTMICVLDVSVGMSSVPFVKSGNNFELCCKWTLRRKGGSRVRRNTKGGF